MIYEDIKNFHKQFEWEPEIENGKLGRFDKLVVVGMGGSNLAADLVKIVRPDLDITVHRDYGLPGHLGKEALVILSSYSGNTEEVLDAYRIAGERGLSRFVVGAGGKLLAAAAEDGVPYIKFPESNIQPRVALGWSFLAILKVIGDEKLLEEAALLAEKLKPEDKEKKAKELAGLLKNSTPIVYASNKNKGLSYFWKIALNETAKIPAFANVFPELNHNEMISFSGGDFHFFFLEDESDHSRVAKRAAVTGEMLGRKGFKVERLDLGGSSSMEKIFNSAVLAHLTAYYLAEAYGVEPEAVSMVEEFKKLIR